LHAPDLNLPSSEQRVRYAEGTNELLAAWRQRLPSDQGRPATRESRRAPSGAAAIKGHDFGSNTVQQIKAELAGELVLLRRNAREPAMSGY
jgi:hypothetical protein